MSENHCPVCLDIYIEPVVLPCEHCFCKPCFEEILKQSTLQCALCRRRIGSWARKNARNGTLINEQRWNYIKKNFKQQVEARIKGLPTPQKKGNEIEVIQEISQTGEIKREYEFELEKLRKEREEQEKASEMLIKQILSQEMCTDVATNHRYSDTPKEQHMNAIENTAGFQQAKKKPFLIPRKSARRSSSLDSITAECNRYFKPIVRYPRTPPRPDTKIKDYPEMIKVSPGPHTVKRLDFTSSSSPPDSTTKSTSRTEKPLTDLSSNIPSTSHSYHQPASSSSDNHFILPLYSSVTMEDQYSIAGKQSSLDDLYLSSSTDVEGYWKIDTPDTSYENNHKMNYQLLSGLVADNNHYSENGMKRTRKSSRSSTSRLSVASSVINYKNRNHVASKTSFSRSSSKISSVSLSRDSLENKASIENKSPSNNHTASMDEVYARKLQNMYDMESQYRLTALRCKGSENEYYTRSKKKKFS